MEWTNGLILEFLNLYQNEPTLWNSTTPEHKNKIDAYDAWNRIKGKLKDGTVPIKEIKKKRDNLMSTYRRQRIKVTESMETANVADDIYKPEWPFYSIMATFLDDIYKPKRAKNFELETQLSSPDNYSDVPIQDSNDETFPQDLLDSQLTISSPGADIHSELPTDTNDVRRHWNLLDGELSLDSTKRDGPKHTKLMRKRKLPDDKCILNALRRLEDRVTNTAHKQTIQGHTKDEFYFFALSVAAQLRNLPLHIAIDTQSKIQNTLSTARLSSIISNAPSPYNYNSPMCEQPMHVTGVPGTTNVLGVSYVKIERDYTPTQESEEFVPENIKKECDDGMRH